MPSMDKWAPSPSGVRDPRDSKMRNGMFWNWPRYLFFGGRVKASKMGDSAPDTKPGGANAPANIVGPISDRGKGRR